MRFVDANTFICVIMKSPKKDYGIAREILERIEHGETAATSLAVVQEVVDFLEYNHREKEIRPFLTVINSYLSLEKLAADWNDYLPAMKDADEYKIEFIDALTLQIMKKHRITEIYSCEKDFDRVKQIKRVWE